MIEIIIIVLLFVCFCLGFYIIYRINKDKKENLNNTNDNILEEIKTDDIYTENDKTINEFYTEPPTIIFNEPWRNQLNNDKINTLDKNT